MGQLSKQSLTWYSLYIMGSVNAKNVALEVLETVGKGKKVNLGKIIKKNGYQKNTADSPKQVTETKTYKETMKPVIDRWIEERDRLTKALSEKDLDKLAYRDGIDAIDKLTKNIQLLNGGKTSNDGIQISWE